MSSKNKKKFQKPSSLTRLTENNENNQVSLKLTDLSSINNISTKDAHDAIVDCMLMLKLMKKIKVEAPEALDAAIDGSSKNGNIQLSKTEPFCLLGEIYRKKKYIYPVIACGQNPNQTNQVALLDLYFDPKKMFDMSDYELSEQFGAGGGLKTISINKSIPLIPSEKVADLNNFLDSPLKLLESRAQLVLENTDFQNRVCELLAINQRDYPPNKYLEQKVYERFPSNSDKLWMERFEISTWSEKAKLLNGFVSWEAVFPIGLANLLNGILGRDVSRICCFHNIQSSYNRCSRK